MKLPVLKAHEDGTIEMVEGNGWLHVLGEGVISIISVFTLQSPGVEGEGREHALSIHYPIVDKGHKIHIVYCEEGVEPLSFNAVIVEGDSVDQMLNGALSFGLEQLGIHLELEA